MTPASSAPLSAPRRSALFAGLVVALAASAFAPSWTSAGESAVRIAPPAVDTTAHASGTQTAVFAGGCFWGVQGVFQHVKGVDQGRVGLRRRRQETADYEMVGSGRTGHAESVEDHLRSDAGQLRQAAADLLLGRARPDPAQSPGPGHRHAVPLGDLLADTDAAGERSRRTTSPSSTRRRSFPQPIVTQVEPLKAFYPAEDVSPGLPDAAPDESATSSSTTCPRSPT